MVDAWNGDGSICRLFGTLRRGPASEGGTMTDEKKPSPEPAKALARAALKAKP